MKKPDQMTYTGDCGQNVLAVTTYELLDIEKKLVFDAEFEHALMLWGPTGIGKSSIQRQLLQQLAESNGTPNWVPKNGAEVSGLLEVYGDWGLIDMRLATKDTTDMQGLLNLADTKARWIPPDDLPVVGQEQRFPAKGILLLDELSLASPAIQAIAYAIALDHKAGSFRLLPGWKVIAASNLAREKTYAFDMAHPLKNRFIHYFVRGDLDSWKKWAYSNAIDERIIAFLTWNETYLHSDTNPDAYGFPTPRAWEMVSDLIKRFANGHALVNISGAIGQATAAIFNGFLKVYEEETKGDYKSIPAVLNGDVKPKPFKRDEPGRAYSVVARMVAHGRKNTGDCAKIVGFLLTNTWEENLEIARICLSDLNACLKDKNGAVHPDFSKAVATHAKAINQMFRGII